MEYGFCHEDNYAVKREHQFSIPASNN